MSRKRTQPWDSILPDPKIPPYRLPPMCYLPPIWELALNRHIIDTPEFKEKFTADDPVPLKPFLEARIQLTKKLVKEKKLDSRIGEMAISHFQTHLEELSAIPINIP